MKKAIGNDEQNESCQTGKDISSAGDQSASHARSRFVNNITNVYEESRFGVPRLFT